MGKKQHCHSFGDWHWHHSHHHHHHHHPHKHLFGSRKDDWLEGTRKSDVIYGRNGDDEIFGLGGNDRLYGGRGDDLLDGGKGNDKLYGGKGDDVLDGGKGNDKLYGGIGHDVLLGGKGNDKLSGGRGDDVLDGGKGNDKLYGGKGDDVLDGGAGSDKVYGGSGNDIAIYTAEENADNGACGGRDFYDGGKGYDVLRLVLTQEELNDADVQADIEAFEAFLAAESNACGANGEIFKFKSFDLAVRNFEALEIEGGELPPVGNNTAPEAVADRYTLDEDTPLTVDAAGGVLVNDTDADGDLLNAAVVDGPLHGVLEFNEDGSFKYTPDKDYFGFDSFSYKASDAADESAVTDVTLEVLPVNDAPRLVDENAPPVWVAKKGQLEQIDIDFVLGHYNAGPDNEVGQTVSLKSVAPVGPFFGNLLGISPVNGNILYIAPNGIPPAGHETIALELVDDLNATTIAELQVDIVL
ncbi:MAG: Ig-like domain-containing protein [Burkholderiales bacterium]|nr:Ig-like domain-containing protein [Burkholderiales bacterium]